MSESKARFWLKPRYGYEEAAREVSRKVREEITLELVYVPFLIYEYTVALKRPFAPPRKMNCTVSVNGITSYGCPIMLGSEEMLSDKPEGKTIDYRFSEDTLAQIAYNEAFFSFTKRYFMFSEPEITCSRVMELYYPYWYGRPDYYVDARTKTLERVSDH